MVEGNIGADSQVGSEHIGGIEPSAEANLNDSDIDFLVVEILEGESGDYFKEREFFFTSTLRYRSTKVWIAR